MMCRIRSAVDRDRPLLIIGTEEDVATTTIEEIKYSTKEVSSARNVLTNLLGGPKFTPVVHYAPIETSNESEEDISIIISDVINKVNC